MKTRAILNAHARRRAAERHGINLTKKLRRILVSMIQDGKGTHVRRQSTNRSLWRIWIDAKPITVVYDKARKTIVTVLPEEKDDETV